MTITHLDFAHCAPAPSSFRLGRFPQVRDQLLHDLKMPSWALLWNSAERRHEVLAIERVVRQIVDAEEQVVELRELLTAATATIKDLETRLAKAEHSRARVVARLLAERA